MKLKTINMWLRRIGLVLTVEARFKIEDKKVVIVKPTTLWLERANSYDKRMCCPVEVDIDERLDASGASRGFGGG